jgi:DNA (cytosine-5)-methyltransferase 1
MPQKRGDKEIWSFFSGALGLDLGLEQAGIAPTLLNEIDLSCCETISRNKPHVTLIDKSIRDLTADKLRRWRVVS